MKAGGETTSSYYKEEVEVLKGGRIGGLNNTEELAAELNRRIENHARDPEFVQVCSELKRDLAWVPKMSCRLPILSALYDFTVLVMANAEEVA